MNVIPEPMMVAASVADRFTGFGEVAWC
jgi:hypothetical protein